MSSSLNDPKVYYTISSDLYGLDFLLHDGIDPNAPNPLYLSNVSYSSDNWQVFYQDDVYFLRNYDYGSQYQLGINQSNSSTQPQLLLSSGDLSQQWNMTLWPDGTRKLTNMAIGEYQFLGVSQNSRGSAIPVMNTAEQGSHWTFDINSSAGDTTDAMQAPIPSVAVVSSTTIAAQPTASSTTPATQPGLSSSPTSSNKLSGGAIAGIAIGAVVLVAFVALAIFFMIRRRRRLTPPRDTASSENTPLKTTTTEKDPPHWNLVEMDSSRPPVELPTN